MNLPARYGFPALAALVLLSGFLLLPVADATLLRPNIVILLADDLGWRDAGCYGGPVKTPWRSLGWGQ